VEITTCDDGKGELICIFFKTLLSATELLGTAKRDAKSFAFLANCV